MDFINKSKALEQRLQGKLPGKQAQNILLAKARTPVMFPNSIEHAIPSAVLVLLYEKDNKILFYLTERTHDMLHHKGQIALPGGTWEEGEKLSETAIRETFEEIGIPADKIKLIGKLTPLFVKVTGYMIHSYLAYLPVPTKTYADKTEVQKIFSVPIQDLINPKNMKQEIRTIRGILVDVPYFELNNQKVWGATAMILSEFKTCLMDVL
ncbi:NUDIX hydrolase [Candidatus Neomarinimicrobiota bacterium]